MQALWNEIRRRNLHRVTAGYAVVAWVLFQGAAVLFPTFGMPGWSLKLLIIMLIIGLPIVWVALWLAHPGPLPKKAVQQRIHHTEWVLIGLLGLVLIASVGEFTYAQFGPGSAAGGGVAGPQDASIAVLAFNDMSENKNNEFFSDGISEELLNALAQVPGLRVAGRTSSFSFKGKSATIREIGKALNVSTVLEGSVQREGDRVRITAQLINAINDFHIWSQTYDRELLDIFAVEDEISHAITRELASRLLKTKLATAQTETTPVELRPQVNPDAYTAYLQGRFYMNKRDAPDMLRAADFFRQAIKLEPDYADAHASLALTDTLLFVNGQRRDTLDEATAELASALKLDTNNLTALLAKALAALNSWNWLEADETLQQLVNRYPNNAEVRHFNANFLIILRLWDKALAEQRRAAELDPLSPVNRGTIGELLHTLGRDNDALAEFQQALTINPDFVFVLSDACQSYADMGKVDEAKHILRPRLVSADGEDGFFTRLCEAMIAYREHDTRELKLLEGEMLALYSSGQAPATSLGYVYAFAGDNDKAMQWFEKAYDEHDGTLFHSVGNGSLPAALESSPRWKALLQRPAFQDLARARAAVLARGAGG